MKKLLLLAVITSVASSSMADGLTTKLEGMLNFETGFRKQSGLSKKAAMDSEAHFAVTAANETDMMKYGARIDLQTTAKGHGGGASFLGSHIFTESNYGKWQFGSACDAGSQMRVTGFDVSRGSGDNWTKYAVFGGGEYSMALTPGASILMGNYKVDNGVETSRKVTYFTPKFMDTVQLGVSYIPDARNIGIGSFNAPSDHFNARGALEVTSNLKYIEKPGVKNAFGFGATIERDISDAVHVKIALTGEVGKAGKKGIKEVTAGGTTTETYYKIDGMKTYNIGAVLNYGVMSFAGSYSDLGKSLTSQEVDGTGKRKTRYYTAAAAYNQGPVGLSFTYARGERLKNKVNSYTLGTDYKLAPGFVPYVEVTYFQGKGRKLPVFGDLTKVTKKGTIALIGATLKF